jgi:hypothetical protein
MASADTGNSASAPSSATRDSSPLWKRAWELAVGPADGPAAAPPQLTLLTVAMIAGLMMVWRLTIGVFSELIARVGVVEPWPEDIDQFSILRYSVRWDSGWYLTIAQEGYEHIHAAQSSIAFFPMFPLSMRYLDQILPGSDILAGLIMVHIALFAALIYIYKLVQIDYPEIVAWRALFFTLIFPASFFFSALYTESYLLLGFVGTLYHARRGQWLLAGAFGIFTGLTKLIGIVLIIPVGLELIKQGHLQLRRENLRPFIGTALVPMGAVAYLASIHIQYGDFREYFGAQEHWQRQTFSPEPFVLLFNVLTRNPPELYPYPANITAIHAMFTVKDMAALFLFLAAGIYLWLRVRPSYGAIVLAGAMVPALSGTPLALTRYMAILFPVFILLATIKSESIRSAIAIIFGLGLMFTTYLFVNGLWAG